MKTLIKKKNILKIFFVGIFAISVMIGGFYLNDKNYTVSALDVNHAEYEARSNTPLFFEEQAYNAALETDDNGDSDYNSHFLVVVAYAVACGAGLAIVAGICIEDERKKGDE